MLVRTLPRLPLLIGLLSLGSLAHAELPPQDAPPQVNAPPPPTLFMGGVLVVPAGPVQPMQPMPPTQPAPPAALPPPPLWLPANRPVSLVPLPSPAQEAQLEHANRRRSQGIAMVVVGNLLQFAGVSLLVPAVWHSQSNDRFPVGPFAAAGGSLVGVGNVIEGFGWSFVVKGGRERERLNQHRPPGEP